MSAQVQIIEKDGKPEYAVVPIEQYRRLLALAEDAADIADADAVLAAISAGEETYPADLVARLVAGEEHPLKVWREYRALTQEELAAAAGVTKSYICQIEAGRKDGSMKVMRKVAEALQVDLDDLT